MVLLLEDVGHLNAVRSPFFTLACKFENNQDTTIWFASEFSDAIGHATMDEDAFWKFLTECLHESPPAGIPLLDGLGKDEAKGFLALGTELRGKPGDTIVRAGDVANEMFVVFCGYGRGARRRRRRRVDHCQLRQGRSIRRDRLPRRHPAHRDRRRHQRPRGPRADPGHLPQGHAHHARTVKVLLNLSLILCERLRTSTENLLGAGADATTASIRYRGSSSNIASPAGVISRRTARRSELPRKRRTYPFPSSAISVCEIVPLSTPGNRRASWDCTSNGWRSRRNAGPPIAPD